MSDKYQRLIWLYHCSKNCIVDWYLFGEMWDNWGILLYYRLYFGTLFPIFFILFFALFLWLVLLFLFCSVLLLFLYNFLCNLLLLLQNLQSFCRVLCDLRVKLGIWVIGSDLSSFLLNLLDLLLLDLLGKLSCLLL